MNEGIGYLKAFLHFFGFLFAIIGTFLLFANMAVLKLIPLILASIAVIVFPKTLHIDSRATKTEIEKQTLEMIFTPIMGIVMVIVFLYVHWQGIWADPFLAYSMISLAVAYFVLLPKTSGSMAPTGGSPDPVERIANAFLLGAAKIGGIGRSVMSPMNILKWVLGLVVIGLFIFLITSAIALTVVAQLIVYLPIILGGIIFISGFLQDEPSTMLFCMGSGLGLIFGTIALLGTTNLALWVFSLIIIVGTMAGIPVPEARPILGIIVIFIALMGATFAYPDVMGTTVFGDWWPTVDNYISSFSMAFEPGMGGLGDVYNTFMTGWKCLASPMECYKIYNKPSERTFRGGIDITRFESLGIEEINKKITEDYEFSAVLDIENTLKIEETGQPISIQAMITGINLRYTTGKKLTEKGTEYKYITGSTTTISGGSCVESNYCKDTLYPGQANEYIVKYTIPAGTTGLAGKYLEYGVEVTYNVSTSAVQDVEVISKEERDRRSMSQTLKFRDTPSYFRWGPVEVGLAVGRKQPLIEGYRVPVFITFTNGGRGEIKGPDDIERIVVRFPEGMTNIKECDVTEPMREMIRNLNDAKGIGLEPGEYITVRCPETIEIKKPDGPSRTYGVTADVIYHYTVSQTRNIQVMYECDTDNDCEDPKIYNCNSDGYCVVREEYVCGEALCPPGNWCRGDTECVSCESEYDPTCCGDGICESSEDDTTCPADCPPDVGSP